MKITVQKWGNSLAVRIPKTIAQETKIERDSIVDLQIVMDGPQASVETTASGGGTASIDTDALTFSWGARG